MDFRLRLLSLLERLRYGLWIVPAGCILLALGLAELASELDHRLTNTGSAFYLFQGGPEGARAILSTITSSMMTFTGVVFSVTVLVLQLASNQFSPRVLRTFFSDRPNQVVLGIFTGTFAYALLALRNVRSASSAAGAHVPALSVWLAICLAILSLAAFVYFLNHVAHSIRAVSVLERIGAATREHLDRLYPEALGEEPEHALQKRVSGMPTAVVPNPGRSGVVTGVNEDELWREASQAGVAVAMVPQVGDFVAHGAPLFEIWGEADRVNCSVLLRAVRLGSERSLLQDPAFGFRQLVDVAERALSPATNDPTTAVQAVDQLHDLLRRLVRRRFPSPARVNERGDLALWLPRPGWDDYVALALDEVRQYGAQSIQVMRRIRFLLEDLLPLAPPRRRAALLLQLHSLDESAGNAFSLARDAARARIPSSQGHGPGTPIHS